MIRCLAIDDEILALDLLEDNIRKVPFLELVQKCRSALEAMEILRKEEIDLIFLDIQMPDISGIQFLKSLRRKPLVIFTTAYEKYALTGYELDVIDYLLKPFSFDRFLKAVNKAQDFLGLRDRLPASQGPAADPARNFIFVKSDYKLVKINLADILYVEGLKDYVKIFAGERPVITLMSMKAIEEILPAPAFIRVHRSFIVNIRKILFIERGHIKVGSREIPISMHYREAFFNRINTNKTHE
ncbi:MAG TPA: LytTR family DNA-binding domain-containing protein [Bacteroidales bacterium]|nr:LytTR family DNA-binding domain-containing protein [Bacteroidales bacterium]